MHALDISLFHLLHNLAGRSGALDFVIIFFGEYYLYVVLVVFAWFAFQAWRKGTFHDVYPYAVAAIAGGIARLGVVEIIRHFYHRPRPYIALGIPHLLTETSYSFPSGHTIFLFTLAAATYFFNKKLAWFLYASGLVVGLARVAAGVHYPSDIVGGAILGVLTGWAVYRSMQVLLSKNSASS